MEDAIVRVIGKDLEAQQRLRSLNADEQSHTVALDERKKQVHDDIWTKAKEQVAVQKQTLEQQIAEGQKDNQSKFDSAVDKLEETFRVHQEVWLKELVNHITTLSRESH